MIVGAVLLTMLAGAEAPATPHVEAADIDLAVHVCDKWLGDPATWADHISEFPKRSGFDKSGLRAASNLLPFAKGIEDVPAAHFWLLKTDRTAIALVTSDVRPICTFAIGETSGAWEASTAWAATEGKTENWSMSQSSSPSPGMQGLSLEQPKDGNMPARLLVFSAPSTPKPNGSGLQLLVTEALQLD